MDSAVQRFYRFHAGIYDATRWMILHGRRQAIRRLALRPDSRVLEIGCGTGLNFPYLLEHLDPRRGRIVGLDFSPDMLRRAQRRVAAAGWPHVELVHADAAQLSLPEHFDAILLAYSLSMIPDFQAALERACAHLEADGRLVVLDFGTFHGWGPLGALARAWLRANHVHVCRPYVDVLRTLLRRVEVHHGAGGYNFIAVASGPRITGC